MVRMDLPTYCETYKLYLNLTIMFCGPLHFNLQLLLSLPFISQCTFTWNKLSYITLREDEDDVDIVLNFKFF